MKYRIDINYDWSPDCPCHGWDELYELLQGNSRNNHFVGYEGENIGDRTVAYVLDVYEHGGVMFSMSGEGQQCQWDTARGGAVLVVKEQFQDEYDGMTPEQRERNARGFLETFNAWANGAVYGYRIVELEQCDHDEWHEADELDSCWGFYDDTEGMADYIHHVLPKNVTDNSIEFGGDAGEMLGPDVWSHIKSIREEAA